ncbi:hypothetical protein [Rhodohalobacter sp. 614A]|nr:hypothetical protein [Rhodohalobacter sp. 614A]
MTYTMENESTFTNIRVLFRNLDFAIEQYVSYLIEELDKGQA